MLPLDRLLFSHWAIELLRILFAAYLIAALWAVGRLLGRLIPGIRMSGPAAWLVEIAAGFALFSALLRVLGFAGLASRGAVSVILLVGAAALWRERASFSRLPPGLFPLSLRRWALVAVAFVPLPMALAPAVSLDALVYQLRFPEMTLWSGTWAVDPTNSPSFFPAATGTLYLAALSGDPSGVTAQLIHYGFYLLVLAAIAAIARRLSGSAAAGEIAALLFGSIPAALVVAGWSWSDMPLCFALLAAVLALLEGRVAAALLAAGLAASVKYSGLALALPVGAAAAWTGFRRRDYRALAVGIAGAALTAAPWYAGNWLRTGNPVYPLLPRLFGGSSETSRRLLEWSAPAGGGSAWWRYVFRPDSVDADLGGVGLAVLLAAALGYAFFVKRLRIEVLLVAAAFAVLSAFAPAARILLPPMAGACVLAGIALDDRARGRVRVVLLALVAILVARGATLAAAHNALFFDPLPCAVGIEPEDRFRVRLRPGISLYDRAEKSLPDGARVLVFGESRMFGFPRPTLASAIVDPPAITAFLRGAGSPAEVVRRLRAAGISHLLVSTEALRPAPEGPGARPALAAGDLALFDQVVRMCRPVDRERPLVLVELPA